MYAGKRLTPQQLCPQTMVSLSCLVIFWIRSAILKGKLMFRPQIGCALFQNRRINGSALAANKRHIADSETHCETCLISHRSECSNAPWNRVSKLPVPRGGERHRRAHRGAVCQRPHATGRGKNRRARFGVD